MKLYYNLTKRIYFTIFVSVSLIALGATASSMTALDRYEAIVEKVNVLDAGYVSITADTEGFIVREHQGIIGIFKSDGNLEYTVDVYVKALPASDRMLLSEGIFAKDKAELLDILEDYDG